MIHTNREGSLEKSESGLTVLAAGSAKLPEGNAYRKQHLALVRYADPISWAAVAAVDQVLGQIGVDVNDEEANNDLGIIACSLFGPVETMQRVAQSATDGMVSPMRFPAANPGALAGVPAIIFRLRGPTLNFTLAPEEAVLIVKMMANAWLARGTAKGVLLLGESKDAEGESEVRCLLLGPTNEAEVNGQEPGKGGAQGKPVHKDSGPLWSWWCQGGRRVEPGGKLR